MTCAQTEHGASALECHCTLLLHPSPQVEKSKDHCKILLLFRRNPYFRNDVVVKEYVITLTGLCGFPGWAP